MEKQASKKGLLKEIFKKFNRKRKEEEIMKKISKISLVCLAVLSLIVVKGVFARDYDLVNEYRREIRLSNERASTQRSITGETRAAEYETGKTITDINGYKVEMEQYIKRTGLEPNQYKLVVLNKRTELPPEEQLTEGYSLKTFNKDLPDNLGDLYGKMNGIGQAPEYYPTDVESRVSNPTGDSWQHDLANGFLYEYATDGSCRVLYEVEKTSVNDIPKIKMERDEFDFHHPGHLSCYLPNPDKLGELLKFYDGKTKVFNMDAAPKEISIKIGNPEANWSETIVFADDTSISHTRHWINDGGTPLTWRELAGEGLNPENWQETISSWNKEHIFGATEFEERTIDIVWSPHSLALEVLNTPPEE